MIENGLHSIGKLKRQPLALQTAELLKQGIETGALKPGMRLIEMDVASELGVSRGILREALRSLEQEGLVENFPGRGTYITIPSEKDIQEIYSLRCILEAEATRLAVRNATSEDMESLQQVLDELFDFAQNNIRPRVVEKDLEFHRMIWRIAGNDRIQNVLEEIRVQITLYLTVNTSLYEDLASGIADHKAILDAIRNKDADAAVKHMVSHLEEASQLVTNFIHSSQSESEV